MGRSARYSTATLYLLFIVCGDFWTRDADGFGLDLGACGDEKFDCQCGSRSGRTVPVFQKQCNFVSNWQVWCRSCENGVEVYKDDVCRRYLQCGDCQAGLKACKTCPPGTFGHWCDQKCDCLNGGMCIGFSSNCLCPAGYRGRFCESRTGCDLPALSDSLRANGIPERNPTVLEFQCPENGFELRGPTRVTCDMATGLWSGAPPVCVPVCSVPEAPANGESVVDGTAGKGLVMSGESLQFRCKRGFTLIGQPEIKCLSGTSWTQPLPYCVKLAFCRKPLPEPHLTYQAMDASPRHPPFSNGTGISFQCTDGRVLLGASTVTCDRNGNWSDDLPTCIKVHGSQVDCGTRGYEVLGDVGHQIRVECPGGCTGAVEAEVWGSRIYDESSSVCRAALHAGKISNLVGGPLLVVNTGVFPFFSDSSANGILSERKHTVGGSFSFQDHKELRPARTSTDCPKGWWGTNKQCFLTFDDPHNWTEAMWMCHNLGSELPSAGDHHLLSYIADEAIFKYGLASFWLKDQNNATEDAEVNAEDTVHLLDSAWNETEESSQQQAAIFSSSVAGCLVAQGPEANFTPRVFPCEDTSAFVCHINLENQPKTCPDPGTLENGLVELQTWKTDGLYVGSIIVYTCEPLYYLEGEGRATCTEAGHWSFVTPRCVKVPTCTDPPTPAFGSFEIAAITHDSRSHGRPPFGRRSNRFGVLSRPRQRRSVGQSIKKLPPGHHHVGTRVFYSCRSRYYELVGSQSRRCLQDGTWSGRHVSCLPLCGRSESPRTPFIVRGNASDLGQWPWQVGIGYQFTGIEEHQLLCAGSLVNELWVLTAAHCVTEEGSPTLQDTKSIQVYAGKYYQDPSKDDEFVQRRQVVEVHVHPDYDPSVFDSDIALIKLNSPLQLTARVQPVCLPNDKTTKFNLEDGRKGVVTGWGLTEEAVNAESLRQAVVRVVSDTKCEQGYEEAGMPLSVSENMFCAGDDARGADACSGDSGGPLVFPMDRGERRHWVLEGIVSWGSLKGCGLPKQYTGFTFVHRFLDWIHLYI